jgi:hypothetical protein
LIRAARQNGLDQIFQADGSMPSAFLLNLFLLDGPLQFIAAARHRSYDVHLNVP